MGPVAAPTTLKVTAQGCKVEAISELCMKDFPEMCVTEKSSVKRCCESLGQEE